MIEKVISGGQTGVDEAGLRAGKFYGLETGGWMPKGFRTQAGPRPEFKDLYGVQEDSSPQYPPRTLKNVKEADATIIFGDSGSLGCRLTIKYCAKNRKPWFVVPLEWFTDGMAMDQYVAILHWFEEHKPKILNVAGNREESQPGIGAWAERTLIMLFQDWNHLCT